MNQVTSFYNIEFNHSLLLVEKSPLKVALNRPETNQYMRVQFNTIYNMNAMDYSYDPDNPADKEGQS